MRPALGATAIAAIAITSAAIAGCKSGNSPPAPAKSGSGSASSCASELTALDAWWQAGRNNLDVGRTLHDPRLVTRDGPALMAGGNEVVVHLVAGNQFWIAQGLLAYDHADEVRDAVEAQHASTAAVAIDTDVPWRSVGAVLRALRAAGVASIELVFAPATDPVQAVLDRYPPPPDEEVGQFARRVVTTLADCKGASDAFMAIIDATDAAGARPAVSLAPLTAALERCNCQPKHLAVVYPGLASVLEPTHTMFAVRLAGEGEDGMDVELADSTPWSKASTTVLALPADLPIALAPPPSPDHRKPP